MWDDKLSEPFDLPLEQPDYETLFHTVIRENTLLELEVTRLVGVANRLTKERNDSRDETLTLFNRILSDVAKDAIPDPIEEWCCECGDLIQDSYGFDTPTGVGGDSQDIIFSRVCAVCWGRTVDNRRQSAQAKNCPDATLHQNRKQMSKHVFCIACGTKL